MRDLYGADIGTSIEFRGEGTLVAKHPWPKETIVSAGHGVVFSRSKKSSYRTLFMEVYPPEGGFLRGEGPTMAACENAAWAKYQLMLTCTEPTGHEFVPRNYHNGAGFCRHCNTFKSQCFTGEQLGQFCHECGIGTTYHYEIGPGDELVFTCKDCRKEEPRTLEELFDEIFHKDNPEPYTED